MKSIPSPALLIKEINDTYTQNNFKNLREYFNKQNQLLNFNFVEFNFPAAVANQKVAHGLGLIPQDVIVTRITGAGTATLNWSLFDSSNLDITTTDACRIRVFVGSYWNFQTALGNSKTDTQDVYSAAPTATVAAVDTTTTSFTMPSGSVIDYGGATAPSGWLLCDGSAYSRVLYPTLFAAIGILYGAGDGSTTFLVPDCRGRVVAGKDDMGGTQANRLDTAGSGVDGKTLGGNGGSENVAITVAQMPSHTHNIQNNNTAVGGLNILRVDAGAASTGISVTEAVGSGFAHNNVQPTIVMNKIIKT